VKQTDDEIKNNLL